MSYRRGPTYRTTSSERRPVTSSSQSNPSSVMALTHLSSTRVPLTRSRHFGLTPTREAVPAASTTGTSSLTGSYSSSDEALVAAGWELDPTHLPSLADASESSHEFRARSTTNSGSAVTALASSVCRPGLTRCVILSAGQG